MINDDRLQRKTEAIEYIKKFPFYKWAATWIGLSETGLSDWRKEDEDFGRQLDKARAEGMRYWGGRATPDLILKSADPETFKDRLDVTSKDQKLEGLVIIKHGDSTKQVADDSVGG